MFKWLFKWLFCDFLKVHYYETISGSYSLESDDDGYFSIEEEKYCKFCDKFKVVVSKERDKALDHPKFLDLLNNYIELRNLGVEISEYGSYVENSESYPYGVQVKIENFRIKYLTVSVELYRYYTNISKKLYIEAEKRTINKTEKVK